MPRDRRILDAAAVAFHEKGFHGVGMDELGRRAGLSGSSLYRYVSGKDEILARLLNEAMDELAAATEPRSSDPSADLVRAQSHHIDFTIANRPLVTLYQREVRSLVDPWASQFSRRRRQYTRAWEELVARAFPSLDETAVAAATQSCLGLIFSIAGWPERVLATGAAPEAVMRLLAHGIGPAS